MWSLVDAPLLAYAALAFSAEDDHPHQSPPPDLSHTDSRTIGIDNRASACMSDDITDFSGPLVPTNRVVKGFAGHRTANVQKGTIVWQWEDDSGKVSTHCIPNSYYVPDGQVRLLSPQHWASTLPKAKRPSKGTAPEQTFHDRVELHWDKGRSKRTVWLDPHTNVATLPLAPNYRSFGQFCMQAEVCDADDMHDPCCAEASELVEFGPEHNQDEDFHIPRHGQHGLDGPSGEAARTVVQEELLDTERSRDTAEFLRYHLKFNHASPKRIQAMARAGAIPARLANCPIPICTACLFGRATRKPWRHKHSNNEDKVPTPTTPGKVVSVDQMVSPTPGLVAQTSGKHTLARYKYATVFVDHASDLSFVHLQKTASSDETVEAKEHFERYARQHGVQVQHYHCDNGVFTSNSWREHCTVSRQGLSFARVNAHHQNGRAERRIRQLQDMSRTMLIHANRRWPQAISANLWPYAMRMASDSLNATPRIKVKDGLSPLSIFSAVKVGVNPTHWHHFGCPVYVLADPLQKAGAIFHKWRERARVGIYLGRSPQHAQSVALVLNPQTGLVSPQFHLFFDSSFQTLDPKRGEAPVPSLWQEKAGFAEAEEPENIPTEGTSEGAHVPQAPVPSYREMGEEASLPIEAYFPNTDEVTMPNDTANEAHETQPGRHNANATQSPTIARPSPRAATH
jgi:hypothetical protein